MSRFYPDLFQKFPEGVFDGYRWYEEDIDSRIECLTKYLEEVNVTN